MAVRHAARSSSAPPSARTWILNRLTGYSADRMASTWLPFGSSNDVETTRRRGEPVQDELPFLAGRAAVETGIPRRAINSPEASPPKLFVAEHPPMVQSDVRVS